MLGVCIHIMTRSACMYKGWAIESSPSTATFNGLLLCLIRSTSLSSNFKICVVHLSVMASTRKTALVQKLHIGDETNYTVKMHN
jgi:hypothetical protein